MEARRARAALRALLRARGVDMSPGGEMRGINRRRARAGFPTLAAHALAGRGLAPPTADELRDHDAASRERFGLSRRFSLPRTALARLLEVAIVLDRAAALAEAGLHVAVCTVFDPEVTPRNIGLFASRDSARLPG
jgi:hypothetical protein